MSETAFAARHTMDSPEWYTPMPCVAAARHVMGEIDLDPASHKEANAIVKAGAFFDEQQDGLAHEWHGRVFLNPPGGLVGKFWKKLLREWVNGRTNQAIWIGYSLEQLQTLQCVGAFKTPLDFSMCVPNKRIAFVENKAKKAARKAKLIEQGKTPNDKSSPSHANYIIYIGANQERFARIFGGFGQVVLR